MLVYDRAHWDYVSVSYDPQTFADCDDAFNLSYNPYSYDLIEEYIWLSMV